MIPLDTRAMPAAIAIIAIAIGLLAPHVVYPVFLMKVLCFMLFASAFNLLTGYAGLLAFGHAMFFGGAGYVAGYLLKFSGWTPELAIIAAVVFAALAGFLMGIVAIGKQGIYFSMITLAIAQMFYFFCVQTPLTGGENGLTAIPRGQLFGMIDLRNDMLLYHVVFFIVAAAFFVLYRTVHSPFGQVLRGIRENEVRAVSMGYDVERFKLLAFVISAAMAGLAGALKAIVLQLVTLVDVSWLTSGDVILMTLVGGIGTIFGPVFGAAAIIAIQNYLTGFGEWIITIQGVIFFFVILLFRRGVVGELGHVFRHIRRKRQLAASSNQVEKASVRPVAANSG
jgi:branched-chain amino acid transport system permease protein